MIEIFNTLFLAPIINLLVIILQGIEAFKLPGALGWAIILLTLVIRLLIWPLMSSQMKSLKKMSELKPLLDKLKEKHKGDKQAFAASQMALYKEHGVNPAAGCLPTLIQLPILIALYQSIFAFFEGQNGLDKINNLLYSSSWKLNTPPDLNFLGVNIALKPSDFTHEGAFLLLVPILAGVSQFIQSKMMSPTPVKPYPSDSPKEKKEKAAQEDTMAMVQSQMMYLMPLMVGYFAFQFPVALSLYWITLTILGIIQQYYISGWGGMSKYINYARELK